jgi:hypothetical protein
MWVGCVAVDRCAPLEVATSLPLEFFHKVFREMPHPVPFFNPAAVLGREDQAEKPLLALNTLGLKIATFVSKQLWLFAI